MKIFHLPKIDQILDCRFADNSKLNKVEILSRAAKATGANKFFMNVSQGRKTMCLHFEKEVKSWEVIRDTPKQSTQQSFLAAEEDPTTMEAKRNELDNWFRNKVYSVVKDTGPNKITTRWKRGGKLPRLD